MGSRYEVEVTMGSARDLKNVNWRHDSGVRCSTRIDLDGGENSTRDEKILILLPPASRLEDAVYASHTAPQLPPPPASRHAACGHAPGSEHPALFDFLGDINRTRTIRRTPEPLTALFS
ncbi:uncharacterized protein LOC120645973 [Panicum virgatum]|uniref:uncharacterized protein LOC120645973 n=1 Tax=Panicum virgatum TaxID=38727 RepID=UPI0019D5A4F5|nr:uncharacterized protein LOC120645973 [Panicum virgatum]